MIIGIIGNMGAGKTITAVALGEYFDKKLEEGVIVSNFRTKPADRIVTNPKELDEVSQKFDGLQILDEIWAWADSRKSNQNDLFNEMVINSRKRGWIIIYTTQNLHMIDKRLRDNTDYVILPEHTSKPSGDEAAFTVVDKVNRKVLRRIQYNPEKFYNHYDTSEEIGTKSKEDVYDDAIEAAKEMVKENPDINKVDIQANLVLDEDVSKTDAGLIATKAINDVKEVSG